MTQDYKQAYFKISKNQSNDLVQWWKNKHPQFKRPNHQIRVKATKMKRLCNRLIQIWVDVLQFQWQWDTKRIEAQQYTKKLQPQPLNN